MRPRRSPESARILCYSIRFIPRFTVAPESRARSRCWQVSICRAGLFREVWTLRARAPPPLFCRSQSTAPAASNRRRAKKTTLNSGASSQMPAFPDTHGHFGDFGGKFVAETLMPALFELEQAYKEARRDPKFHAELEKHAREYVGRPTPLFFCASLTAKLGGAKIYLKREV